MNQKRLLTYCGVYGGSCARNIGYEEFRKAAKMILEIIDAHGFQFWMPSVVKEFNYEEFRKGIEFFSKDDAWIVCEECCEAGLDDPPGCVRSCCLEHDVDVCFECNEFPCEKVENNQKLIERSNEFKRLGREQWLLEQEEKARKGYENHAKKFYSVNVSTTK